MSGGNDTARHLLFGLLALQTGLIDQAALVAALHASALDRTRLLTDHFVALGHMSAIERAAIEALADVHAQIFRTAIGPQKSTFRRMPSTSALATGARPGWMT
jgi:hypothetical protein